MLHINHSRVGAQLEQLTGCGDFKKGVNKQVNTYVQCYAISYPSKPPKRVGSTRQNAY